MKPTTTLQTQAIKHRQFHPFPIKNSWGFIGNGQNVSFCLAPPTALLTAPPPALPMPRQRRRRAASLARILQPRCQQQRRRPAPFTPLLPPPGCAQQPHAAGQTQPVRHSPANPSPAGHTQSPSRPHPSSHPAGRIHPVTQLAASTQSRHLVTTFSHQQRWCAKPARPAPAQPSGAAQGRR